MVCARCSFVVTEDRLRHQYYQLSQKYVDQLVSSEVIDIDGVLDVIGQLEKALSNLLTPIIDQAIGLVKKAAQIISKPREKQEHYVIAFNALAASLEKIDTAVTPTGTSKQFVYKLTGCAKLLKEPL